MACRTPDLEEPEAGLETQGPCVPKESQQQQTELTICARKQHVDVSSTRKKLNKKQVLLNLRVQYICCWWWKSHKHMQQQHMNKYLNLRKTESQGLWNIKKLCTRYVLSLKTAKVHCSRKTINFCYHHSLIVRWLTPSWRQVLQLQHL
jgi:hypothetical protein